MVERMRTLEQAADQPQAQTEQQQFQQQLATNPPAPQRLAMLARLDEATGSSAIISEILTTLARQLAQARGASGQDWDIFRAHLVNDLRADLVNTDLFVYHTESDADLEAYVRLHETPEVRRFFQAMGQGISKAIATSLQNFLNELGGKLLEI